ncbi:iron-sulfur cluster repair protein YtfE [Tolumonas lignilytica]|jgi:iron-sulfur cluster repair di-iron protein|uniref:iron-sulfur cluster repair protein YtfE n=1 Tax=Tolumonas lignilytica TaxID=1283284 RepID=UPI000464046C|nr:iron-sulfur cluster repair protein YtfE [Tolumonas lignilytica]
MNYLTTTLAQLACDIPGATRVFHKYKLDFCCGGKKSLADAIEGRNFTAEQIIADLDSVTQLQSDTQDWRQSSPTDLIDHILNRYHNVHRIQLPELVRLAKRVEHVHGERTDCPKGLAAHLEMMLDELESHMQKEEQILFPLLKSGNYEFARGPIMVMQQEHDGHGNHLETIFRLTDDITPPPFACVTWRALYTGLTQLKEDLMAHIHLENNVLFPAALIAA